MTLIDRQLAFPLAGSAAALLAAFMFFSTAKSVTVPQAPESLFVGTVHIDQSERTMQRFERPARPGSTMELVTLLTSDDYPGVTFRLMEGARHLKLPIPATLELQMSGDPVKALEMHRQFPNFSTQIDVLGVRYRDEVLADPAPSYQAASGQQGRYTTWGQAALLLSAILLIFSGRIAYKKWRNS